jgi:hypothetical protein
MAYTGLYCWCHVPGTERRLAVAFLLEPSVPDVGRQDGVVGDLETNTA